MDISCNARFVAYIHRNKEPTGSTYVSVVSSETVLIVMNYEDLNGLNFVAAGIYNAYLMTPTIEKHCIICGPEFVSENFCGETASGRSREARARQIAHAGKLQAQDAI